MKRLFVPLSKDPSWNPYDEAAITGRSGGAKLMTHLMAAHSEKVDADRLRSDLIRMPKARLIAYHGSIHEEGPDEPTEDDLKRAIDLLYRQEIKDIQASVAPLPLEEQMRLIGAGMAALREVEQTGDATEINRVFDVLSATISGFGDARLEDIAEICRSTDSEDSDAVAPEQVADSVAAALSASDRLLMGAMVVGESMLDEDLLYRRWAITAASYEEIARLLHEDSFDRSADGVAVLTTIVESYTHMALGLSRGEPLPKFRLDRIAPDRSSDSDP